MQRRLIAALIAAHSASVSVFADETMDEIIVTGDRSAIAIDADNTLDIAPDTTKLLRKVAGANINHNGALNGIAQYRGMFGPRIHVAVDGSSISSAGPNWMDPPLSYAPAGLLESLTVYRGIAPVSAGQETIGGAIKATTWSGDFTDSDTFENSGRLRLGAASVDDSYQASVATVVANRNHRFKVAVLNESGDDAEFPDGDIIPTEYERERYDLGYGFRTGGHTLQIDVARNETGESGTPALPMDIDHIDADLANVGYSFDGATFDINARVFYSDIEHGMTNFHLRQPPGSPAMWRRNEVTGENRGFALDVSYKSWTFGVDAHYEEHESDISNPNNGMFFVENFNGVERQVIGVFAEREFTLTEQLQLELGVRFNRVEMDADTVDGTPARMTMNGMSPGQMLRDNFNNADRSQTDNNVDWVAKLYFQASDALTYYAGVARKTRSASYQERYLWLPLQATGGLADGRTYTGNIELDAEVAHELELGFDFDNGDLTLSPRVFYRDVDDYIQGTVSNNNPAVMFVNMMNMMNGTNNAAPLEFNNVDAELYGFDMDWSYRFNSNWSLAGIVSYVRGKRDDISDDLYRIAPLNGSVAVHYTANNWGVNLESVLYAKQDKVSDTNSEQETAGYGLLNLGGYWQISEQARLAVGVENVLDKEYSDHLAGVNRVRGNEDIATGERLPGYGRSLFARIDYQW